MKSSNAPYAVAVKFDIGRMSATAILSVDDSPMSIAVETLFTTAGSASAITSAGIIWTA